MLNWKDCPELERHPEVVSGDWVSKRTRLPVEALFENLKDGARVDDFIAWFPGVTRHQIQAVLHDPNDWRRSTVRRNFSLAEFRAIGYRNGLAFFGGVAKW